MEKELMYLFAISDIFFERHKACHWHWCVCLQ
jgi:hypothetical protein